MIKNVYLLVLMLFFVIVSSLAQNNSSKSFEYIQSEDSSFFSVIINGVAFNMVKVEGGTFIMGATEEQDYYEDRELPTHSVTLTDYYLGQSEVTQALWEAVMDNNPSLYKGVDIPVNNVSWKDCQEFIKRLNALTGLNFCLPTEAQWEYAARGGNKSKGYKFAGSDDFSSVAWCSENSEKKPHPVMQKQANELGLFDMSGNVREWCQDYYGSYSSDVETNPQGPSNGYDHVYRGGCWGWYARECRVSYRSLGSPYHKGEGIGLRLCLLQ